jgi:hypothetical protein
MADKPGHVLEIPDSLGRDLDKAAAGKIPAPPIEAFMSDGALQAAEDATRASSAPVHAGDLTPVSAAEAARMATFDGQSLPRVTRRRVIPAPYRRPRISGGRHGKTWQSVPADEVVPGDMTELAGKVADVRSVVRREEIAGRKDVAVGTDIIITGIGGVSAAVDVAARVRVFRS